MPKFVIQEHFAERAGHHYDLRLEIEGVAKSWALRYLPQRRGERRLAIQTEDHTLEYMDFEGVIPAGYGKGKVLIWDRGTYELLEREKGKVTYPALKGGASPVPPAFTADSFMQGLRARSRVPHPTPLIKERAKFIAEFKSRL